MAASIDNLVNVNFIKGDIDLLNFGLMLGGSGQHKPFPFSPARLFDNGEQGAWYLIRPQLLFQDAAGTVPVTTDGDPVGRMLDQSGNGYHAIQTVSGQRFVYRTDGTLHWLEGDGVDDFLQNTTVNFVMATSSTLVAGRQNVTGVQGIFKAGNASLASVDEYILIRPSSTSDANTSTTASPYAFSVNANTNFLTELHHNSTKLDYVLDGSIVNSASVSFGSIAVTHGIVLLASLPALQYWDGRFYGAILRTPEMTAEDKTSSRQYLANLSGVTL